MTNAEKIRNMKDEELDMLLMCPAEYDLSFNRTCACNGEMDRNCYECTMRWLQQQVD